MSRKGGRPGIGLRCWRILLAGVAGALCGALYGALHDQVTYTLSPEYYSHFKFRQFAWLLPEWAARWRASGIGVVATFWVGGLAGLLIGVRVSGLADQRGRGLLLAQAFTLVLGVSMLAATTTALLAPALLPGVGHPYWSSMLSRLGVSDAAAFVRVGYIHTAGYLGGGVGAAFAWLWVGKKVQGARVFA